VIKEIGELVFEEAARQVVSWREGLNPAFQVSINNSPVQINSETRTASKWETHLSGLGLPGESIVIEITEGVLLDSNVRVNQKLKEFHEAQIQISIDDFGTGYSSLSYLQKFDIDYLKIDRAFVCNLESNPKNKALCNAVIVMAHELGLKVVAEGVETAAQRDFLIEAKCDFGQGYFFSEPLAAEAFEQWIRSEQKESMPQCLTKQPPAAGGFE